MAEEYEEVLTQPSVNENFLTRTFFIYDKTAATQEEDDPLDQIVYFYPHDVR